MTSAAELATVPADLIGSFNLIFYSSAEDAVYKALGVEWTVYASPLYKQKTNFDGLSE